MTKSNRAGGEMSELATRAKELAKKVYASGELAIVCYISDPDRLEQFLAPLIEQALLAERRLAMEEAAKIADSAFASPTVIAKRIREMTAEDWTSVDERLPELKEIYSGSPKQWTGLICNIHGHIGEGSLKETWVKRVPSWKNASDRAVVVTHWREFPAPPVGGE